MTDMKPPRAPCPLVRNTFLSSSSGTGQNVRGCMRQRTASDLCLECGMAQGPASDKQTVAKVTGWHASTCDFCLAGRLCPWHRKGIIFS